MKKETDCCAVNTEHPDYHSELSRLNRVAGQIEGVKKMIGERRYCPDILTQLRAVRAAINSIEANILETHLGACVNEALTANNDEKRQQKIAELKELYKRYNG